MAIFVLLRFSYSETGPFLRPAAARRPAGLRYDVHRILRGAPDYSPCCGERTSMPAGLRASSGSETPAIGAMPAALRPERACRCGP